MASAWQQQVFALDARFNAHRAKNHPNFRTLYIRRRNQLLREFGTGKETDWWKQYLKIRSCLLQIRYGTAFDQTSLRRLSINTRTPDSAQAESESLKEEPLTPTQSAEASRALVGNNTIYENYAFVGVHHIFDQHTGAVSMVKFANNDRARLCCVSNDNTVSICNVLSQPPTLECVLKGHSAPVTGCDWSAANDLLVTSSLDGQICVWDTASHKCIRSVKDSVPAELLCCLFHPVNNNIVVAGNNKGKIEVLNISTGIKFYYIMGGQVLCLAFESNGQVLWAGNDQGQVMSTGFDIKRGKLINKFRRINLGDNAAVTSINWRSWISREARDPSLLVNVAANSVRLYRISAKGLELKKHFRIKHVTQSLIIKSTFCPIMSFRKGACVVTGSEDSCIYFLDVESEKDSKSVINKLQGHSSPVLSASFNYDESLIATSDTQGLVIVWTRATKPQFLDQN